MKISKNTIDNRVVTILIALVLVAMFSVWNLKVIEAKQGALVNSDAREEILWLARVVYSETKRANEQVLIAWVVRNRVETSYTGESYRSVAKAQGQFSGLNRFDKQFAHNISRSYHSEGEAWERALKISEAVYSSPSFLRPFPKTVRHFYSPRSVQIDPEWSASKKPVLLIKDNKNKSVRFAFYDGIK